jgi:DNA-binding beta-propeller fold protein YncE
MTSLLIPLLAAAVITEVPTGGQLKEPFGTEFDTKGTPYVVEMMSGNRLFRIEEAGRLTQLADGFTGPHNLAILPSGDILIGDTWAGNVKLYTAVTKQVSVQPGFQAPKGKERGAGPYCIALTPDSKTLLIANLQQIHAIDLATGKGSVLAGNGKKGKPEDGAKALDAPLVDPRAVAQDSKGSLYILERGGNALRVVDTTGTIRTVVNASGKKGHSGEGGPALATLMNGPKHLCIDIDDTVLIADAENHVILRYDPKTTRVTRIAGTGKQGTYGLDGDPLQCELARPHGVSIHPITKDIWITDSYNNRVLKMTR